MLPGDRAVRINADATSIIQLGGVVRFHGFSFGGTPEFLKRSYVVKTTLRRTRRLAADYATQFLNVHFLNRHRALHENAVAKLRH